MAETIRIEIPITARDETAGGVSSAQSRLDAMERALQRLERSMSRMQQQTDRIFQGTRTMNVGLHDDASGLLSDIEGAASRIDALDPRVDVAASGNALDVITEAEAAAEELDATEANPSLSADDGASGIVQEVQDAIDMLDGSDANTAISADDGAGSVIQEVQDAIAETDGMEAHTTVTVDDQATATIEGIKESLGGLEGIPVNIGGFGGGADLANAGQSAITKAAGMAAAAAGFAGMTMGIGDSVDSYKSFEYGMQRVAAISGATTAELDTLTAKAQEMGATTMFTASQSAEAFTYMAMAGWKSGDMMSGIAPIMNLAAASGESLGLTADIVTDALTAFGLTAGDATHFSDVLAQASSNANTNVSMLGESFKYVAPIAGAMGYSIEDTGLALGLMANSGIKASMAGTALRRAISALASPTDKQAEAFDKYGISLTDSEGQIKSLGDVMTDLRENLSGLSDDQKTAAVSTMFGNQALAGMLAIINATDADWNKLSNAVYNADGATQQMADTMMNSLQGSMFYLSSAWEAVQNTFGERMSPYIRDFADGLTEALPLVSTAINDIFDDVDSLGLKFGDIPRAFKENLTSMLDSEDWQNAEGLGKLDVAWNQLIAQPFQDWAGSTGVDLIGSALRGMFSSAGNVLSGEGELSDWLGVAALAKSVDLTINTIGKIGPAVDSVVGFFGTLAGGVTMSAGTVAMAAVGIALAIAGISAAVESYNNQRFENNLAEHMGDVKLSIEQARDLAEQVIDTKVTANIEIAVGEIKGADEARSAAEKALQDNKVLEYKNSVGIELTAQENTDYMSNIQSFIDNSLAELEKRTYTAHLSIETMLGGTEEGQTLANAISSWTLNDTIEMDGLSSQLTQAVNNALSDGIMDVDEQAHIQELQSKMQNILGRWKAYESKAEMDMLRNEFGQMSGAQLEAGSFETLMEALRERRATNDANLRDLTTSTLATLMAMEDSGRLAEVGTNYEAMSDLWYQTVANEKATELSNEVGLAMNTLTDAYSSLVTDNITRNSEGASSAVQHLLDNFESGKSISDAAGYLSRQKTNAYVNSDTLFGVGVSDEQGGLAKLYEMVTPDVQAMTDYIDSAFDESGNQLYKIPQQFMDQYNSAMEVAAASGDQNAAWQLMANEAVKTGNEAFIDALVESAGGTKTDAGKALHDAMQRAMAETTDEPLTADGFMLQIKDPEIADFKADNIRDRINDLMTSLSDTGSVAEVEGGALKITLGEVDVDEASAASRVSEALGMTMEDLSSVTGTSMGELEAGGVTITIPEDSINLDTAALDDAMKLGTEVGTDPLEIEQQVDTTYVPGETDMSGLEEATEDIGEMDPVETELTAEASYAGDNGTIASAYEEFDSEADTAFGNPVDTSGTQVTASAIYGGDNGTLAAAYSQFAAAAQAAFATPVSVTATVNVTASATGGVSGAAGNAEGGYIGGPLLSWIGEDGPEYVIPVGSKRKGRGLELWEEAGRALGAFDGLPGYADGGLVGGSVSSSSGYSVDLRSYYANGSGTPAGGYQAAGASAPPITVNMSPSFTISGDAPADQVRRAILGMTDTIAAELGQRLAAVYSNMPSGAAR